MVNKEKVLLELSGVECRANKINEILPKRFSSYTRLDQDSKAAIEWCVLVMSYKEFDLLYQLYSELNLGIVGDSNSLLKLFEGKLSGGLIKSIAKRKTLRNLLVHSYSIGRYDKRTFEMAKQIGRDVELLKKETGKLLS